MHNNNSRLFDDFAPLTRSEPPKENPADPDTKPIAAADLRTQHRSDDTAAAETIDAPAGDETTAWGQGDAGWDWVAQDLDPAPPVAEFDTDPARAVPRSVEVPAPQAVFPMDYAVDANSRAVAPPQPPRHRRSWRGYVIASAMLTVVLAIAATGAVISFGGGDDPSAAPSAPTLLAPTTSAAPPLAPTSAPAGPSDCPTQTVDGVTTGRDPGGTSSGPAVIKAFEYAYYVERNGNKARSYASELARMGSAESMQTYIDASLAPGTLHCVKITDRGPGLWGVELTETPPGGGEPTVMKQVVQTADIEGRTVIVAITKDTAQ